MKRLLITLIYSFVLLVAGCKTRRSEVKDIGEDPFCPYIYLVGAKGEIDQTPCVGATPVTPKTAPKAPATHAPGPTTPAPAAKPTTTQSSQKTTTVASREKP